MLTKKELDNMLEVMSDAFGYAYYRWLDEQGYEDINDYAVIFEKYLKPSGTEIVVMQTKPFGFIAKHEKWLYNFYIEGEYLKYKLLTSK